MTDHHARWHALAQQLRANSIRVTTLAGSGHPTSSLSAADLMAVLLTDHLRYDFSRPDLLANDTLLFSKGHATPLLYSMYLAVGAITEDEFVSYRRLGSRLEGHPTPKLPFVPVATGSLGQGLGIACGIAIAKKRLEGAPGRVWTLLGDGEMAEGAVFEAMEYAAQERLDNLVALVDVNRLGQSRETTHGWNTDAFVRYAEAFGWRPIPIDGHDYTAIDKALHAAASADSPTMIIAKTIKGRGVSFLEDKNGWHGKALSPADAERAVAELQAGNASLVAPPSPPPFAPAPRATPKPMAAPEYPIGAMVATREAYGAALAALGHANPNVVVVDADVSNSTFSEVFRAAHPDRYFEVFIREQQMIALAVGLAQRGWVPFASTFGAFLTRAADFIRTAAISGANLKVCGSHAGVSIGEDGPSQMALEDLAMMRAVHGSVVLYPCDAGQTVKLIEVMANHRGIAYLRTTRERTPVRYPATMSFAIGGSVTLAESENDRVTIVAAGVTVGDALKAHDQLREAGVMTRVIDAYSVKPIDYATLKRAAAQTGAIVVVEDHWPEGGLGDAVLDSFADASVPPRVVKLAPRAMPGSATPEEQRRVAGIDAEAIVRAVRAVLAAS